MAENYLVSHSTQSELFTFTAKKSQNHYFQKRTLQSFCIGVKTYAIRAKSSERLLLCTMCVPLPHFRHPAEYAFEDKQKTHLNQTAFFQQSWGITYYDLDSCISESAGLMVTFHVRINIQEF